MSTSNTESIGDAEVGMALQGDADVTRASMTLPAHYYVDPEYFEQERRRFFAEQWVCVGRDEQIARPGEYFVCDVAGESLIVTRDDTGMPHAFCNVCRHRGARVCESPEGFFKGRISCPYHAWTYALDGRLVRAPHMDDAPGFRRGDYPLHRAGCDSWDGHLWVNLSKDPPPLRQQLAGVWEKFRPWRMEELRRARQVRYAVKANWKLIVQNYSECLHCPVIHPTLKKLSHYMSGENDPPDRNYLGGHMTLHEGVQSMTVTGTTSRRPLPGLSPLDQRRVHYYWISPNLLLSLHPDYVMTHTLWPRRVDLTEILCETHFHPDEIATPDFSPDDATEFWDEVNREDWHVSELSQLGIASRAYTPGPYSPRETLLAAFDRIVTGEL